ncbi:hypothetical protein Clacol_009834 [Clathrus columnatus]|uniref:Wax synthase domain-containing protein n=1 Tax=Clathrus columnatus TaxID=1419009 RepID=A0AAV5ALM7_9AGAM|nr:hypothetical protein Clacol_009834 [Clathrus columnatus]
MSIITELVRKLFVQLLYYLLIPQLALLSVAIISRALEIAFMVEGMRKANKGIVGQTRNVTPAIANYGDDKSRSVLDAIELLCSIRGIGFEYGQGVWIPSETRPIEKRPFLCTTLVLFIRSFVILDVIESLLKLTPPLQTPQGGSIFLPSLPKFQRYIVSTLLHVATGCGLLEGFQMVYFLCSLIAVGFLNNSPTAWPPIFDHPWDSYSLQDFWSRRWHQLLRRIFMVFGGMPGKWVGSKLKHPHLGQLLGVFIASGLYHEIPAYAMGKGFDWRVPAFFLLHALLVLGERFWRSMTGRKVGGRWGRFWQSLLKTHLVVDSWHTRGLGGGLIIPPAISPMRRLILPIILQFINLK